MAGRQRSVTSRYYHPDKPVSFLISILIFGIGDGAMWGFDEFLSMAAPCSGQDSKFKNDVPPRGHEFP